VGGADDTDRRAVADACQRTGVAVGHHPGAVVEQRRPVSADGPVALEVLLGDLHGLGHGVGRGPRPLDAPRQVHGRRPGGDQRPRRVVDVVAADRRQGHAHGQCADGLTDLFDRAAVEELERRRQPALVDQPEMVTPPLDGGRDR
jgi:hypothetical protein